MRANVQRYAILAIMAVGVTCESGAPPPSARWWMTCGDPACSGYGGPFEGVPSCTDEAVGDECTDNGAECDPEDACNARLLCAVDDPTAGGCPISRAVHKTDIRYLDDTALRSAADRALATRLATWRYRWDDADSRPHFGFVIDDDPTSPAVSDDGQHVDLYGYASLALAAVQQQQAEIDALRDQVEAMRAACAE